LQLAALTMMKICDIFYDLTNHEKMEYIVRHTSFC